MASFDFTTDQKSENDDEGRREDEDDDHVKSGAINHDEIHEFAIL
jgi:hypothetical protein